MKVRHVFGRLFSLALPFLGSSVPLWLFRLYTLGSPFTWLFFTRFIFESLDSALSLPSRHFTVRRILHLEWFFRLFTSVRLVQFPLVFGLPCGLRLGDPCLKEVSLLACSNSSPLLLTLCPSHFVICNTVKIGSMRFSSVHLLGSRKAAYA